MDLSDRDADLITRTIIAENAQATPSEAAAIASVILNRVGKGEFGDNVRQVLWGRTKGGGWEFTPWGQSGAPNYPMKVSPKSPDYQTTRAIVDAVASGDVADPTNGALYYYAPQSMPSGSARPFFAQGSGQAIGAHRFYAAPATQVAETDKALLDRYFGKSAPASSTSAPQTDEALLSKYFGDSAASATPTAPTANASQPGMLPAPPNVSTGIMGVPPEELQASLARGAQTAKETSLMGRLEAAHTALQPANVARSLWDKLIATGAETGSNFMAGVRDIASAPNEWAANRPLAALGNIGWGALRMAGAPVTAGLHELVGSPVYGLTGNEDLARRAEFAAGLFTPLPKIGMPAKLPQAINATRGPVRGLNELVGSVADEELPAVIQRLERNPNLALGDVARGPQSLLQGVAVQPGSWQGLLDQVARQRGREAYDNVVNATNELKGSGVSDSAYTTLNAIIDRAKQTGKTIDPLLKNAKPVDISPVLEAIDKDVKPGIAAKLDPGTQLPLSPFQEELLRLKQKLTNPETGETLTDAGRLHDVQSDLRAYAQSLIGSSDGKNRYLGGQLMGMRGKLVDAIDEAAPGYGDKLGQYRSDKEVREAFAKGMGVSINRRGEAAILEDGPEAWRNWVAGASKDEIDAARVGALADLQRRAALASKPVIEETAGAPVPNISQAERARFDALFGAEKTNEFIAKLRDVKDRAELNRVIFGGSDTARRMMAAEAAKVREPTTASGGTSLIGPLLTSVAAEPAISLLTGAHGMGVAAGGAMAAGQQAARLGRYAAGKYRQAQDIARNETVARYATAGDSPERDELLALLRARLARQNQKALNLPSLPIIPGFAP